MNTLSPRTSLSSCSITVAPEMRVFFSDTPFDASPNTGCQTQRRSQARRQRFNLERIVMRTLPHWRTTLIPARRGPRRGSDSAYRARPRAMLRRPATTARAATCASREEVVAEIERHRDRDGPAGPVQAAELQARGERGHEGDLADQREPQRPGLRAPGERDDGERCGDEMNADVQAQRAREFARSTPTRSEQLLEPPRRECPQHQHQRQRDQRQSGHHAAHGRAATARDAQRRARVGARCTVRGELRVQRLGHGAADQRRRRLPGNAATTPRSRPRPGLARRR